MQVEPGRRLVEEDDRWPLHEGRRHVETPPHAPRVGAGGAVGGVPQLEPVEQVIGAGPRELARQLGEPAREPQVLGPGEVGVDRGELTGEADQVAHLVGLVDHVAPEHPGPAGVGVQDRREDPYDRRLARAVRSQEAEHGARGDVEADAVDCVDVPEVLDELLNPDCAFHGGHPPIAPGPPKGAFAPKMLRVWGGRSVGPDGWRGRSLARVGPLAAGPAQRTWNPVSPTGSSKFTSIESTVAPGGPWRHQSTAARTAFTSPSNTASTRPSRRLETKPVTPNRAASFRHEAREEDVLDPPADDDVGPEVRVAVSDHRVTPLSLWNQTGEILADPSGVAGISTSPRDVRGAHRRPMSSADSVQLFRGR